MSRRDRFKSIWKQCCCLKFFDTYARDLKKKFKHPSTHRLDDRGYKDASLTLRGSSATLEERVSSRRYVDTVFTRFYVAEKRRSDAYWGQLVERRSISSLCRHAGSTSSSSPILFFAELPSAVAQHQARRARLKPEEPKTARDERERVENGSRLG